MDPLLTSSTLNNSKADLTSMDIQSVSFQYFIHYLFVQLKREILELIRVFYFAIAETLAEV